MYRVHRAYRACRVQGLGFRVQGSGFRVQAVVVGISLAQGLEGKAVGLKDFRSRVRRAATCLGPRQGRGEQGGTTFRVYGLGFRA